MFMVLLIKSLQETSLQGTLSSSLLALNGTFLSSNLWNLGLLKEQQRSVLCPLTNIQLVFNGG